MSRMRAVRRNFSGLERRRMEGGSAAPGGRLAGGGGAAAGGPAAVGGRVGEEDSAGWDMGAEGGAAGKTTEASCGTIEAGGETVGAWSAGDAAEEVDGAAGGRVDCTGVPSAVLRVRGLGSVARDGVEVEGRRSGMEERGRRLGVRD
jgi:hypothetical protein